MNPKLEAIYKQIPKSKCQSNCGECCGILFPALIEIRNIKEYCLQKHIEYKDFTMNINSMCPYLTAEKTCQIYPARPFLCRILAVSSDKRLLCKKCTPEKTLNPNQTRYLMNQIYGLRKEKGREAKHQRDLEQLFKSLEVQDAKI